VAQWQRERDTSIDLDQHAGRSADIDLRFEQRRRIGLAAAFMTTELVLASPESANVIIYCQNVDYPAHCVARPGVVLGVRPVARAAAREAVRPGTPTNRGGPVDRADRR
jgi:hypothetical protein